MKKKIDKVRVIDLKTRSRLDQPGMFPAELYYDVSKLKRVSDDDLTEILFDKTLMLYPFAIIGKEIFRSKSKRTAFICMTLPLNPCLSATEVPKGE